MYVDNGTGEVLVGETRLGNEPPNAYGKGEPPPHVRATP
jgi:hypothetical protein